jgi:hypothetical protein
MGSTVNKLIKIEFSKEFKLKIKMTHDIYTITQINGVGFIVQEKEWEDYQKYFCPETYEAFFICDKEETQEMGYLFYQIFVCEKTSLIFNEMYLSKPEDIYLLRNETSVRAMIHPYFEPLIDKTINRFQLNEYKECSYWSLLTSFGVGRFRTHSNFERKQFSNFDDFRKYFEYE